MGLLFGHRDDGFWVCPGSPPAARTGRWYYCSAVILNGDLMSTERSLSPAGTRRLVAESPGKPPERHPRDRVPGGRVPPRSLMIHTHGMRLLYSRIIPPPTRRIGGVAIHRRPVTVP